MTALISSLTNRYSRQGLWSLFLMCAFPLHLWTLILIFRDMSWVAERTNSWDAVGVASYGVIFAFVESVLLFLVVTVLGFVTPKQWEVDRRIAFLTLLVMITSLWGMISQLLFIWNISLSDSTMRYLAHTKHPLRILYEGALAIVIPTVVIPVYGFIRSDKFFHFIQELIDRLSLLTMFYLVFDVAGLIIVIIRNV